LAGKGSQKGFGEGMFVAMIEMGIGARMVYRYGAVDVALVIYLERSAERK
jgi:hypothetical protein